MPAGATATNGAVNNGGGTGAATIDLRGLGTARTLILVNGRRLAGPAPDVNAIPINLIERVEVLKDGASAIYGSDAIGGVVNFILRRDYQGVEFAADYGVADADDGQRKGFTMTLGHTSDKGSLMIGVNYHKQDAVSAADRDFLQGCAVPVVGFRRGRRLQPHAARTHLPAQRSHCGSSTVRPIPPVRSRAFRVLAEARSATTSATTLRRTRSISRRSATSN